MIEIYRDTQEIKASPFNPLYALIKEIDFLVQQCAERAYNIKALDENSSRQMLLFEAADKYLSGGTAFLLQLHYGYAVEDIVNRELSARYTNAIKGYKVQLQVTHGHTRPDIVITDQYRNEVAWLDITSENSAGHIWNKDGSGWSTRGFVAELLYPTFDISMLRNSDDVGIGVRARTLSLSRLNSVKENRLNKHLITRLTNALDFFNGAEIQTKATFARAIENAFNCNFERLAKHSAIKSMLLKYLKISPSNGYTDYIRQILKEFYKFDLQNISLANEFISESFDREQENQRIFDYLND